jgi:glutamate:GABA antiporter
MKLGKPKRVVSVFMLTMINVATIGSILYWPMLAEYGFSSLFFILLATLVYLIPISLVSAELATTWPQLGGVFAWVKEAFGHRWGFLAAWLVWVQNVIWYPTILSFIAATIAYIFKPELSNNPWYTLGVILIVFWTATFVNFKGMRTSGWISSLGMLLGTILPGSIIILLGVLWFISGDPLQIAISWKSLIPDMSSLKQLILFTGVLTSLSGMEMSAVHARDVEHPKKTYPKAIFLSALIILSLSIPGVLSVAIVVPQEKISLIAGTLQALEVFFHKYSINLFLPYMALLISIGSIASVSTWTVGPTKSLLAAAQIGDLPPIFQKLNKNLMPVPLLILQAIVVSLISLLFVFFSTLNAAYWFLMALVSELYLVMYILMFAAAIKLRYKHPNIDRPYKIPGKKMGIWLVAGTGLLSCLFTICIGILPPQYIQVAHPVVYVAGMVVGGILLSLGPTFILLFQKKRWKQTLNG